MGYRFDFFVEALECMKCGRISPDDISTNMQTYIRNSPELTELRVGRNLEKDLVDLTSKGYLHINGGIDNLSIIEYWSCPYCGAYNWAKINIENGKIVKISSIILSKIELESANYITQDSEIIAMELIDVPKEEILKKGTVKLLQELLQ
jgi:uncharacterized Zn finger protein